MLPSAAATLLLAVTVLLRLPGGAALIPTHEVDAMLSALHSLGPYNLIANAIATSDLRFDILRSSSFTLFAPPDASLFPLALTLPSSAYVAALRLHSSPRRYSSSDLHRLVSSSGRAIPTLLTPRSLRLRASGDALAIDNVEVSSLGIFYSHNIAVHGISGAITLRDERHVSPPLPPSASSIRGMHDQSPGHGHGHGLGHGHFFRIPRSRNRTDHSLENHIAAVSPAGFKSLPAPAPTAPAPTKLHEAADDDDVLGNIEGIEISSPSTETTTDTEGSEADPADFDTLDEAYIWSGGDIDSLFDEYL